MTTPAPRTSLTHPLQIAEVTVPKSTGRIGITFCPGKRQPSALTGAWDRDLGLDLDRIRDWGASTVITLLEPHELTDLAVPDLGREVLARGLRWLHLPITDVSIPDQRFDAGWRAHGPDLLSSLRSGHRLLVHCKGGLGRAGTVAALMLVQLGLSPDAAIASVRAARPGAIETPGQERYLRESTPVIVH